MLKQFIEYRIITTWTLDNRSPVRVRGPIAHCSKQKCVPYDDIHNRFRNGCMMMIYIIENKRLCWLSKLAMTDNSHNEHMYAQRTYFYVPIRTIEINITGTLPSDKLPIFFLKSNLTSRHTCL
jgi:hypothetical protein